MQKETGKKVAFLSGMFLMLILCVLAASHRIEGLESEVKQLKEDKLILKEELLNCYRRNNK